MKQAMYDLCLAVSKGHLKQEQAVNTIADLCVSSVYDKKVIIHVYVNEHHLFLFQWPIALLKYEIGEKNKWKKESCG